MDQYRGLDLTFVNKPARGRSNVLLSMTLCALVLGVQACPSPLMAQEAAPAPRQDAAPSAPSKKPAGSKDSQEPKEMVSRAKPTSPNWSINLMNLLVAKGVLKEEQAQELIKQANDEAYVSRQAAKDATAKADEAAKAATAATAAASPPGSKHVTYVPELVKKQLRDELKKEVLAQAKTEGWASPGTYPEWASRIRFYGDVRTRYEAQMFPKDGYNAPGRIINFNAINTGSPYDISNLNPYLRPTYDSDEDRQRFRLRARLGMDADLLDGVTAGFRIATGDSNSPVSTNQTMGGSGGDFSKYSLWLDRAFIRYRPNDDLTLNVGRFDNPFFSPTDLVWYSDLGFDGASVQAKYEVTPGFTPFAVAGAFPIFNTDLNFATSEAAKFPSQDKYLFGGQLGFNWRFGGNYDVTFAAGYFDFTNVRGELSSPCDTTVQSACDTDSLRPSFAQKGNTYMALRNIVPPAGYTGGDYAQPQYFGLAGDYRPIVVSTRIDFSQFDPIHVVLDGEYVWNTAFDRSAIAAVAVNNFGPSSSTTTDGPFAGGDIGWMARLTVGNKKLTKFGDWNVFAGYKYLESDATIDAFTDSDFGLGGTNLKGYIVGGNFALSPTVSTTLRWLSANAVAGDPYSVDVLQLDLNAKF